MSEVVVKFLGNFLCLLLCIVAFTSKAAAEDEVAIFDGHGRPVAYIALDDGLNIYLWNGSPVAYLERDQQGGFHIYGYNGNHLGWFLRGVFFEHTGYASCATKDRMGITELEPLKSLRALTPLKSLTELPPLRPLFTDRFGDFECAYLLASGR